METKEVSENGIVYIEETYPNGTVIRYIKPEEDEVSYEPELTETEVLQQKIAELEAKLDTQNEQLAAVKETTDATAMAVVDIGMAVMMP